MSHFIPFARFPITGQRTLILLVKAVLVTMIETSFRNVSPMMLSLSATWWLLGHISMSGHSSGVVHTCLSWVHIIVVLNVYLIIYVIHMLLLTLLHLSLISVFSAILLSVHVSLFWSIRCIWINLGIRSYMTSILLLIGDVWKTTFLRVRYLSWLGRCKSQRIAWIRNSLTSAVMESGHTWRSSIQLIFLIFTIIRPNYILSVIHPMST